MVIHFNQVLQLIFIEFQVVVTIMFQVQSRRITRDVGGTNYSVRIKTNTTPGRINVASYRSDSNEPTGK